MRQPDIDKAYVSPIDKFLRKFDANTPLSDSQRVEIEKHQRIAELRDNAEHHAPTSEIWKDF